MHWYSRCTPLLLDRRLEVLEHLPPLPVAQVSSSQLASPVYMYNARVESSAVAKPGPTK